MNQGGENTTRAIVVSILLVLGASLFNDPVVPFYSVTFGAGMCAAYFAGVNGGPVSALMISSSVLVAMVLQGASQGGEAFDKILLQLPALVIFFLSFSVIPTLLPWILLDEETVIAEETSMLESKIAEFDAAIQGERKEKVEDRGADEREALVKITSRTTQLSGFLRDVLQASSPKEISQLLFTNVTKSFGANEVALLTVVDGSDELVVTKAAHPDYGALEGKRVSLQEQDFLRSALEKTAPMLLPDRMVYLEPDLGARLLIPLRVEGRCEALVTLGRTRQDRELEVEDAHFLGSLAELAGFAIEQLKVVLDA